MAILSHPAGKARVRKKGAETTPLPAGSPPMRRLPVLLRRCWFNLNQAFRRRIAHTGITPDQFTALRNLSEGDPLGMTQRALTDVMSSDANTIASLLDRMEKSGLVERKHHEKDRRAYRIFVTPRGQKKFEEVRKIAIDLQTEVTSAVPVDKKDEFLKHLEILSTACKSAAEKNGE